VGNLKTQKKVILDALGGDNGIELVISGAIAALKKNPSLELVLVGDAEIIGARLEQFKDRIEIIHTKTNIEMNEIPTEAIRKKTDSSLVMGLDALKSRLDCGALLSAGSTGAVLTGAFMKLGRIEGVSRPAMCCKMPTLEHGKKYYICDCGANMDTKPQNLLHFAIMADEYLRGLGCESPRVGLLSVGTEEEKGNELTHEAYKLLTAEKSRGLNFVGNVEARDLHMGVCDIVICDGFAGNVLLKAIEGASKHVSAELKNTISGVTVLLGKLILARRFMKLKKRMHDESAEAAVFLGVKKPVLKCHGNADIASIRNGVLYAARLANMDLNEKIGARIKTLS
jgi:glycerol-3-phosphate acyltransferase PlsX